jgi:hypothetical protein
MKRILVGFILMISCQINAQEKTSVIYDNHTQVRKVPSFTAISVSSAIDLYLTQANSNEVAVSATEDEIRDHIITEVVGGTLIIRLGEHGTWFSWKKWGNYKTKAYVSIKEINAITASGASNVHLVSTLESPKMRIKLSGASDFYGDIKAGTIDYKLSGASEYVGKVTATNILIEESGASSIDLEGTSDDLSLMISGASDAKLYKLVTKGAVVHTSGASHAKVNVTEMIKAVASGASDIDYKGNPAVKESSNTGASNIRHRN